MKFRNIAVFSAIILAATTAAGAKVSIQKIEFRNHPNCYKLDNGAVEAIVTTDFGPRIVSYKLSGKSNVLAELSPEDGVKTEYGKWQAWGGHRLWHAPEVLPRTYVPDDKPVEYVIKGNTITLTQKVEGPTMIQKEISVTLDEKSSLLTIDHKLTNRGTWAVELAPWALTIMKGGGEEFIPNEPYIPHDQKKLPARPLMLWNYTDLTDSRIKFGSRMMRLKPDTKMGNPIKIGVLNTLGWTAYQVDESLFVKRYSGVEGLPYPDGGCNFETYISGDFIELESLAPLTTLEPGQSVDHQERWYLHDAIDSTGSEADVFERLSSVVKKSP